MRVVAALQLAGQAPADSGDAVALGNLLPLNLRASLGTADRRGHRGGAVAPTQPQGWHGDLGCGSGGSERSSADAAARGFPGLPSLR